ncbi:hypothetical protein S780_09830 [Salmonella enterica]|nr:hypothetical protein [Salmonella enterica subsp. enterica serovar Aschersleben]EEJ7262637.1 hypothetical protein [Salmonella enterica subsp. enterica]MID11390.1 hypothetical protein [Salmonella enterica]
MSRFVLQHSLSIQTRREELLSDYTQSNDNTISCTNEMYGRKRLSLYFMIREISLFVLYRIINSQEGIAHIQK